MSSSTPKVITFAYKNFESSVKRRSAQCRTCGEKINDGPQTTSNFTRHLKTHPEKYVFCLFAYLLICYY